MELTIILTVYNKEKFLFDSFSTLLNQEGAANLEYEILVVNDGSTDGSATIIDSFAKKDSRVRVLTQCNQGISMARNNGIDAARGRYIWFVDGDDEISRDSVMHICMAMKSNPDIIPIYGQTKGIDSIRNAVEANIQSGKEILISNHWVLGAVFYVLSKSFLRKYDLRFLPNIYHEDAEFTPRMLYAADTVAVVPRVLYIVNRDPYGITQMPRPKRAFDYLIVAERLSSFVMERKEEGSPIGCAIDGHSSQFINNAFNIICKNSRSYQRKLEKDFYKKRKALLRVLMSAPNTKYRLEAILFRLFPNHYLGIYKLLKIFH